MSPILLKSDDDSEATVIGMASMATDVPGDLYDLCHFKDVYELRIGGPPDVTKVIAEEVRSLDRMNHSENKINVEIIE